MRNQIVQNLIALALISAASGAAAEENYIYAPPPTVQRNAVTREMQMSKDAAAPNGREEDMEYRALVKTKEEPRPAVQPGDVTVRLNGPKLKMSLAL
jgi:hypothetical protein